MKESRIAWIGAGHHTQEVLFQTLRHLPVRVTAVCDIDEEKARAFAARVGIPQVCADFRRLDPEKIDGVVCVAPASVNYQAAAYFISRGIPVFVEKLPCEDYGQARCLAQLEKDSGSFIQTGFNRRFATCYVMMKKLTKRPEFGGPTMLLAKFNASAYRSEEALLKNHLSHHLDLVRFLVGEVRELQLQKVKVDEHRIGFHIMAKSESGVIIMVQSGSLQDMSYPMERVELTGIGSVIIADNMRSLSYYRPCTDKSVFEQACLDNDSDVLSWKPNLGYPFANDGLGSLDEMRHFIACVQNEASPLYPFSDTVNTMALLDQILRLNEAEYNNSMEHTR